MTTKEEFLQFDRALRNLRGIRPEDVDLGRIATSLSHQCRFLGRIGVHYSVAQHSVMVADRVLVGLDATLAQTARSLQLQAWGLLHDAAEAWIGDIPRPLKERLLYRDGEREYLEVDFVEERILKPVAARFGLVWPMPEEVARVDAGMLAAEAAHFFGAAIPALGEPLEVDWVANAPKSAYSAKCQFVWRANELGLVSDFEACLMTRV
jgi:hypothetical protein